MDKVDKLIKEYEGKKAENAKLAYNLKGWDASTNAIWIDRIDRLFGKIINDLKQLKST